MTTAARPAPLTRHPAFRWGVAAWFALLLGLGLFVMPEAVHQAIGEKLGLGGVLPGAEAKRVVLSLLAALLGLGIGLVLAMRVTALSDAREPGWAGEIAARAKGACAGFPTGRVRRSAGSAGPGR